MGDGLDEFGLSDAVLLGPLQVERELLGVAAGNGLWPYCIANSFGAFSSCMVPVSITYLSRDSPCLNLLLDRLNCHFQGTRHIEGCRVTVYFPEDD
jgi:hypothetical protein